MNIKNIYNFGDIVYLVTDMQQEPRCITGISIRPGHLVYLATDGTGTESGFYGFELSDTKNPAL